MSEEDKDRVDLSLLEAIPFKNTVSVLNEYIINTSEFANKIMDVNEKNVMDIDLFLSTLEDKVSLLEKKLDSVP
jgi:D-ribose pyranose/furanose isomerase RbsD